VNDTGSVPIVDTSRDELRERIALAGKRFDRLVRDADPNARPPGQDWTAQQIAAHVLTLGHRYRQLARGGDYCRAVDARGIAGVNQAELEAAMAPMPELADQLQNVSEELDSFFDATTDDRPTIPFHAFGFMSGITAQTNWLGELLLHGEDIAKAVGAPWELPECDMLLILRGAREMAPLYLRPGVSVATNACVAFAIPEARPYLIHVHHGTAQMRERRPDDRPDAVLRVPASALTQLRYQRIGPFTAVCRGLRIVGGRRPWVALKLMSYFERP
jgi:mycothiol maleylpyruvate isomerase-like protein